MDLTGSLHKLPEPIKPADDGDDAQNRVGDSNEEIDGEINEEYDDEDEEWYRRDAM